MSRPHERMASASAMPSLSHAVAKVAHILARERAAAEQGRAEARALLVHERREPDRARRLDPALAKQADGVEAGNHAKRAIEAPTPRHGVDV